MSNQASANIAIEVNNLSKAFGRSTILRDINLTIPRGQLLTILGHNGSGKTTLIKILSTLLRPDQGTVHIAGLDISENRKQIRRVIGVVTHSPFLYDQLTGYENLKFTGRIFGLDNLEDRISSVANQFDLTTRLHQQSGILSHGMRKRLSIAKALIHDPEILLMDEPDTGLDQKALEMLHTVFYNHTNSCRTILTTTHNLDKPVAMNHTLAFLSQGRISHQMSVDSTTSPKFMKEAYSHYT